MANLNRSSDPNYRSSSSNNRRITIGSQMTKTDQVFEGCVDILQWGAKKTGMTYRQINVAVFCVVWPVVTIGLVAVAILKNE